MKRCLLLCALIGSLFADPVRAQPEALGVRSYLAAALDNESSGVTNTAVAGGGMAYIFGFTIGTYFAVEHLPVDSLSALPYLPHVLIGAAAGTFAGGLTVYLVNGLEGNVLVPFAGATVTQALMAGAWWVLVLGTQRVGLDGLGEVFGWVTTFPLILGMPFLAAAGADYASGVFH